ncbi:MAG: Uma2 family endonuclease [Oscillochloridaceae bacterium umkhey_bin13]
MTISTRLTVAALAGLNPADGSRYELIEGELHVTTQPNVAHQLVADAVCRILHTWNRRHGQGGIALSAPGVILSEDEAFAPDVVWYSAAGRAAYLHDDGKFYGPPDLAVEVLSAGAKNEQRDRVFKPARYAFWGIREYWLVDRFARQLLIHRLEGRRYRIAAVLNPGEQITSPLLPGLAAPVDELFADLDPTLEERHDDQ